MPVTILQRVSIPGSRKNVTSGEALLGLLVNLQGRRSCRSGASGTCRPPKKHHPSQLQQSTHFPPIVLSGPLPLSFTTSLSCLTGLLYYPSGLVIHPYSLTPRFAQGSYHISPNQPFPDLLRNVYLTSYTTLILRAQLDAKLRPTITLS